MNFVGLEITKTRNGFEVKNSTDFVESLLNLYGLQKLETDSPSGRRSTVVELASATPLDGQDYSNIRTAVDKLTLHGTLETRHAFCHPTTIHTCPQPHDREQARSEVVDTISQVTQHTCLRLEPREMVQTGLLELVGRSDSDWAGD